MNAKEQLDFVRDMVGEGVAAHWTDVGLLRRINAAQELVALKVAQSPGQWLVKSGAVTPVASVITLPTDCSKPIYLEETSSGAPIDWIGSVTHRRVSRGIGAAATLADFAAEAYPLADSIEVNAASYVTPCTLWYQKRVPKLHTGDASGAALSSLTFELNAELVYLADYYAGVTVEQYNAAKATAAYVTFRSLITASTVAGACTVTGTPTTAYAYGTISVLPQETHLLMCYLAAADAILKPSATIDDKAVDRIRADAKEMKREVWSWLETRIPGGDRVEVGDAY
jgi:hypothetical protein